MEVLDSENDVQFDVDDDYVTLEDVTVEWAHDVTNLISFPHEDGFYVLQVVFGERNVLVFFCATEF